MKIRAVSPAIAAFLVAIVCAATTGEAGCAFVPQTWLTYGGTKLFRNAPKDAYLYITGHAAVDADGAPTAYHPDDVGKPCGAIGVGLDCPANAGYPNTNWWPSVLARDPSHPSRAYVQKSGPSKGFFVSKTALFDKTADELDTDRYVDAAEVPYLVFPGPFSKRQGTGKLGDIGAAYHLETKKWTPFVVADIGPSEPLGEGSIALFEALGGDKPNPRNGQGIAPGKVVYIVFPGSVDARSKRWPLTKQELSDAVGKRLKKIPGGSSVFENCKSL